MDSKTETSELTAPTTESTGTVPNFTYNTIRVLADLSMENWLSKHNQGKDEELLAILDDPRETPKRQGEAADVRYIRTMVRQELSKQQNEAFPSDIDFPLGKLDDASLSWLLVNAPEYPTKVFLEKEAQRRELQPKLDHALNSEVPRDLISKLSYKSPKRKSEIK